MPNNDQQILETSQQDLSDDKSKAEQAINLSQEYLNAVAYTSSIAINGRVDMLKDYAHTSTALLAAIVAILTIDPRTTLNLIKTFSLFYIGSSLILIALLLIFMIRRKLVIYLERNSFYITGEYSRIVDPARVFLANINDQDLKNKFFDALNTPSGSTAPKLSKLERHGDKYAGIIILVGTLCVVLSLLFKVTT